MPNPSIQPLKIDYDLDDLVKFLSHDDDPIICFYGGDPLIEADLVEDIIRLFPKARFVIQTNGLWFDKLKPEVIRMFDTILISIDGRQEVTDFYRGAGVYRRVLENARYIRSVGFKGDLVARMAVSGKTDIYLDVKHLLELSDPQFDHVHWQLDALWDFPPMQRYENFMEWLYNNYFKGLHKLLDLWVSELSRGKVLGIAPFKGIVYRLLTGYRKKLLPCGSGIDAFAITTDGRILACPIAPEYNFNVVGDLWSSSPKDLYNSLRVGEPCLSCNYFGVCGGRCLFANKTMLWGRRGFELICESVKYLVDSIREYMPIIKNMLDSGTISLDTLRYPPYLNSIEVIP